MIVNLFPFFTIIENIRPSHHHDNLIIANWTQNQTWKTLLTWRYQKPVLSFKLSYIYSNGFRLAKKPKLGFLNRFQPGYKSTPLKDPNRKDTFMVVVCKCGELPNLT